MLVVIIIIVIIIQPQHNHLTAVRAICVVPQPQRACASPEAISTGWNSVRLLWFLSVDSVIGVCACFHELEGLQLGTTLLDSSAQIVHQRQKKEDCHSYLLLRFDSWKFL